MHRIVISTAILAVVVTAAAATSTAATAATSATTALPACTIVGGPGDDQLTGTAGPDVICGFDGNDRLWGMGGNDVLIGGNGDDQLFGGAGDDTLYGDDGFDFLKGDGGSDTMYGGAGGDTFKASLTSKAGDVADGTDVMVGGPDLDTVDYSARTTPVNVTLDNIANDGAPGENDSVGLVPGGPSALPDIESVSGGSGNDVLVGNAGDNFLVAGKGVDTVRGLGGHDVIDVFDRQAPGLPDTVDAGGGSDECVVNPNDHVTACELQHGG